MRKAAPNLLSTSVVPCAPQSARNKVIKTIEFKDNGQDFLTWGLDRDGYVRVCEPAQSFAWLGRKVLNHDSIRPGDFAELRTQRGRYWHTTQIKHPVIKVTKGDPA